MSDFIYVTAVFVLPAGCGIDNNGVPHGPDKMPDITGGPGHKVPPDQNNHIIMFMPQNMAGAQAVADRQADVALLEDVMAVAQAVFDGT